MSLNKIITKVFDASTHRLKLSMLTYMQRHAVSLHLAPWSRWITTISRLYPASPLVLWTIMHHVIKQNLQMSECSVESWCRVFSLRPPPCSHVKRREWWKWLVYLKRHPCTPHSWLMFLVAAQPLIRDDACFAALCLGVGDADIIAGRQAELICSVLCVQ